MKNEIIKKCKDAGACKSEFKKPIPAKTECGFWGVLFDDWELVLDKTDASRMFSYATSLLLRKQPQFFDILATEKMSGNSIGSLLQGQPQFIDRLGTGKMNTYAISALLQRQPQLADRFKQ